MDPSKFASSSNTSHWIQSNFIKRECVCIVPTSKESNKCGCGRYLASHYYFEEEEEGGHESSSLRWSISRCTGTYPTDSFGTLAFQGIHGPNKAQYIRLDFSTEPSDLWRLLVDAWGVEPPKLVITVHGGSNNFEITANLSRALRKGLLKAAKTTNAWIITTGIRMGVVKHVVAALSENFSVRKQKFTVIGIVSWGAVRRNEDLTKVTGGTVPYYPQSSFGKSRSFSLCEGHTCFLLVDNGTVGRTGAEIFLRRRFEEFLKQQPLGNSSRKMPLVCLVLGGGRATLQSVLSNATSNPPVPTVVCSGSGRAADVLAFALDHGKEEKDLEEAFKRQLTRLIEDGFALRENEAHKVMKTALHCSKFKHMISIFNCDKGENGQDDEELDCSILNTLLKGHNLSPVDRLGLLLTWNREDMAKEIFEKVQEWPDGSLNQAMMYALISDRVEFVQLLLNNGMAMDKFLNYARLEELYNTDRGPPNTLKFILQDVVKDPGVNYKYKLPHIGLIIEKLMGSGYRATYCRQDFRRRYKFSQVRRYSVRENSKTKDQSDETLLAQPQLSRKSTAAGAHALGRGGASFQYPYHELFIWAVLTKRHEMAMCMWQRGEEPLAKALVGFKLNKALAKEAEEDYLEMEVCQQFKNNANEFKTLAYDLVEQCYQTDDDLTLQLLTYELKQWSRKNCLSLAALSNYKKFLAHASCQMLLADLWLGGLRIRKKAHLKVILSVILPPLICLLQFKTQEQLLLQAQTAEEFHENRPELNDDEYDESCSSSGAESSDEEATNEGTSGAEDIEANGKIKSSPPPPADAGLMRPRMTSMLNSMSSSNLRHHHHHSQTKSGTSGAVWFSASSQAFAQMRAGGLDGMIGAMSTPDDSQMSVISKAGYTKNPNVTPNEFELNMSPRHSSDMNIAAAEHSECPTPTAAHARLLPLLSDGKLKLHSMLTLNFKANELDEKRPSGSTLDAGKTPLKRNQQLSLKKKIREFYQAPIACFWSFVIGYMFFLGTFTYTVLVKTLPFDFHWAECYVIAFIASFASDQIRRVLLQEPKSLLSKLKVYSQSRWDVLSCAACVMFFVGVFFRVSQLYETMMVGRVIYCCNIVFWYMRVLHLLTVSPHLGPFITMYGKMVAKMFLLSNILAVVLASFGVLRQSLMYPNEEWHWALLRNIAYKPYFMLYGELYAEEIDTCGDNGTGCDVPGAWLTPFFMTIYLLLSIIVFVNMMIAAFNFVFLEVNSQAHIIWKFQRFEQVMEYEQQPFLPPPFIVFVHFYLMGKYFYKRVWKRDKVYRFEHSLKLFLSESELDKLHDFERECLEEMTSKKKAQHMNSNDERVKHISEKVDVLGQKLESLSDRTNSNRLLMLLLQEKLHNFIFSDGKPNLETTASVPATMSMRMAPVGSLQDLMSPTDIGSLSDADLSRHGSTAQQGGRHSGRYLDSFTDIEGKKIRAPHRRSFGDADRRGDPKRSSTMSRNETWASSIAEKASGSVESDATSSAMVERKLGSRTNTELSLNVSGIVVSCSPEAQVRGSPGREVQLEKKKEEHK